MKKNIYELDLHEEMEDGVVSVIRVPGGWLYSLGARTPHWTTTFVPYENGFDLRPPPPELPF